MLFDLVVSLLLSTPTTVGDLMAVTMPEFETKSERLFNALTRRPSQD
jgi:hypothetical protein